MSPLKVDIKIFSQPDTKSEFFFFLSPNPINPPQRIMTPYPRAKKSEGRCAHRRHRIHPLTTKSNLIVVVPQTRARAPREEKKGKKKVLLRIERVREKERKREREGVHVGGNDEAWTNSGVHAPSFPLPRPHCRE